ncbi:hypothetical protein HK100_005827 [Physocladia obscura]|uniref:Uncharacterized protein n=1 Tax=Physocladia obscura TaxID=109957 RepID=A0AAD5SR21_9FUNG|nr:hypothetical protein HK100_005827 [Physocladia obscura]
MAEVEAEAAAAAERTDNSYNGNEDVSDDARAVAQRLFETAIEQLEAQHIFLRNEESATTVKSDSKSGWSLGSNDSLEFVDDVLLYSRALLGLAALVGLPSFLDRVVAGLSTLIISNNSDALLLLARARLMSLCFLKKLDVNLELPNLVEDDEDEENEQDSDNDQTDDESMEDAHVSDLKRAEVGLLQEVRETFLRAIVAFNKDVNLLTIKKVVAAQYLRNFALLVRQSDKKSPIPIAVITFALSLLSIPNDNSALLLPDQQFTDTLNSCKASCLYHLARFRAAGSDDRAASQDIKESIRSLQLIVKPTVSDEELLGQGYIFLSTVSSNDDTALASYSRGTKVLQALLDKDEGLLSPQLRKNLSKQLESLGANDIQDDSGFENDEVFDLDAEIQRDELYSDFEDNDNDRNNSSEDDE